MNLDITKNIDFINDVVIDNISFSYIKESNIHGFGLFAVNSIKNGSILGFLDGQIMSWSHYDTISEKVKNDIKRYENYIFMEWNALDENTLIVRPFRTKYSYINHSYNPNLKIEYNPLRIIAIMNIDKDDEFTIDYTQEPLRKEYKEGHGATYL